MRPLKVAGKGLGIHVARQGLDGVQAVHAGVDQAIDDAVDGAAGVQDDLLAEAVALLGEPPEPGQDELVELRWAADQVELGAEVIAEEEGVASSPARAKKSSLAS